MRIEILGFGLRKTQDFYIQFIYCFLAGFVFFPLTLIDFYGLKGWETGNLLAMA